MSENSYLYLVQLFVEHFSLSELKSLCYDLDIEYEDLPGPTLSDKARELINYCKRRNCIDDLVSRCEQLRPSVDWKTVPKKFISGLPPTSSIPPAPYSKFIMREKAFSEVVDCLKGRNPAVLISGMGGTGKTSLAIEISHLTTHLGRANTDSLPHYDGAIWIDVNDKNTTLDTVLNEIARELGYPGLTQDQLSEEKKFEINKLLRTMRILIVIDNFEEIEDDQIAAWIVNSLPEPSKAIIISRQQYHSLWGACLVRLHGMETSEAQEFIGELSRFLKLDDLTKDQTSILIEATGGNPYAIELIMRFFMRGVESFDQIIGDLYASREEELFDRIFSKAWQTLNEDTQKLFMLTTLFPDSVSKNTLLEISNQKENSFKDSLGVLVALFLITKISETIRSSKEDMGNETDESSKENKDRKQDDLRYSLHPLSRAFASEKLANKPAFARVIRKRWLNWVLSFLSAVEWPWHNLEKLDELKKEEPVAYTAIKWASTHDLNKEVITLAKGLDHYYYVRGHWDKKAEIDQLRINAANAIKDFAEEAISISQYAQMLSTRGKQEDLEQQVKQKYLPRLAELEEAQQLPPNTIAAIRHANAFYHIAQGEYDTALAILSEFQNQAQSATANYAIANRHWSARCLYKLGRLQEAEDQFKIALQEANTHQYLRSIAFCKRNLAEIALDKLDEGAIDRAQELIDDAYKRANKFNDRRYLAQSELVYARLYLKKGKYKLAKQFFDAAEDGYKRLNLFTEREERETIRAALKELFNDRSLE